MKKRKWLFTGPMLLAGCASIPTGPNHPASPDGPEAKMSALRQTLVGWDDNTGATEASGALPMSTGHEGHDSKLMTPSNSTGHEGHAMEGMTGDSNLPSGQPKAAMEIPAAEGGTVYGGPMDPEILRDKPGDCPICGMKLKIKPREPNAKESDHDHN